MERPALHFCHANGFPAKSYGVLLDKLSQTFDVSYLDMHGHQLHYPVTDNWPHLVDELIDEISSLHQSPIIAVGHSMGGALIYMAARKQPELFKQIILLDPPLLDSLTAFVIGVAKRFNFIDRITPAGRTNGRQELFDDHDHAFEYFSNKSLFKQADPRCLQDYIHHGTQVHEKGLKLKYAAHTEVAIYRTLPHKIPNHKQPLAVPATLVYGESSDVIRPALVKQMQTRVGMNVLKVKGGHLFPFEFPEQTAHDIEQIVEAL
jgi:pimeloyl-ACP methyl ester carboxylesterase